MFRLMLSSLLLAPAAEPRWLLAASGRTSCTILVHRDAPPPERQAVEERARFLQQINGATFRVRDVTGVQDPLCAADFRPLDGQQGIPPQNWL